MGSGLSARLEGLFNRRGEGRAVCVAADHGYMSDVTPNVVNVRSIAEAVVRADWMNMPCLGGAEVPTDLAYFHGQWRRSDSVRPMEVHNLLDDVCGHGHYVGAYLAWGVHNNDWWCEGEIKFYLDEDADWPTICGTGTEDYFGGAWNLEFPQGQYGLYSIPYLSLVQVIQPDGLYQSQQRFGLYRWHILDPIRFQQDLRVTIQDLGFRSPLEGKGRFYPRRDEVASTAFWYQNEPHAPFPPLPGLDDLEVI